MKPMSARLLAYSAHHLSGALMSTRRIRRSRTGPANSLPLTACLVILAGGVSLSSPASAAETYMWGVGPSIGTNIIPGAYPVAFPQKITDAGEFEKVRGDVRIGLDGIYYINHFTRVGVAGGLGFGSGYTHSELMLKYHWLQQAGALDLLVGAGAGIGSTQFRGAEEAKLIIPNYPIRAEFAALIRDNWRGYQLTIFGQYNIQARHLYTDAIGADVEVHGGFYGTVGVEIAALFGDFTPPRPVKSPPAKKGGKKGGKKR